MSLMPQVRGKAIALAFVAASCLVAGCAPTMPGLIDFNGRFGQSLPSDPQFRIDRLGQAGHHYQVTVYQGSAYISERAERIGYLTQAARHAMGATCAAGGLVLGEERLDSGVVGLGYMRVSGAFECVVQAPRPDGTPATTATTTASQGRAYHGQLIAVLELKNKLRPSDRDAVDAAYFGNLVRGRVKKTCPDLEVMDRENVLVLLTRSGRNLADCEGECEVDTARLLGADLVVSGDLVRIGQNYKLDLRLHDVRTARLLSSATASAPTVEQLDAGAGPAVADLLVPLAP